MENFRGEKLLSRYGSHYLLPPYISKQNKTKQKQEKREEQSSTTVSQDPMVSVVFNDRRKVTILLSSDHVTHLDETSVYDTQPGYPLIDIKK
ncbi:hypothetical protein HZH68_005201 [Vespula germanica]|uniref:Uncharacterized protein n=2 Tax=Vespula TaxID=7451 RepID=A0A834KFU8_VESGE|nr:hypothetical protein HZH66_004729 [Vespula vulgaris]KAF7405832.1 hypothetical protein HZH68_005201 [Vespula germanica]